MTILITGANGQLAHSLSSILQLNSDIPVVALNKETLDITNRESIKKSFSQYQPTWVLNTAAYVLPDKAETEQEKTAEINAIGPGLLAEACDMHKAKLIQFSTDYIFDGKKEKPYIETDQPNPLSVYGKTKYEGELNIQNTFDNYLIIRVCWIFSAYGRNFVKTILKLLETKPELRVVNDQRGCPTYADHISMVIKELITKHPDLKGIYHYSDQPSSTWYDLACAVQDTLLKCTDEKSKNIIPISTSEYPLPAERPHYSVLSSEKLQRATGIKPYDWKAGLEETIKYLVSKNEVV